MKLKAGSIIVIFSIVIFIALTLAYAADDEIRSAAAEPWNVHLSNVKVPRAREPDQKDRESKALAEQQDTLRGLKGFMVFIEAIDADVASHGLTGSLLRREVESRLRRAEISVLTPDEAFNLPGKPFFYVHLTTHNTGIELYSYALRIELNQDVCLIRDPSIKASATTWFADVVGIVGARNLPAVAGDAAELTEKFIREYRAANRR